MVLILPLKMEPAKSKWYNFNFLRPGEGTMEMKIFINNLSSENKAFDALKSNHKTKL